MADNLTAQPDPDELVKKFSAIAVETGKVESSGNPVIAGIDSQRPRFVVKKTQLRDPYSEKNQEDVGDVLSEVKASILELSQRIDDIESEMRHLRSQEKKPSTAVQSAAQTNELYRLNQKIGLITSELNKITAGIKATPGFGIQRTFKCEHCDSEGMVATVFRCTSCGHQSWRGWWPKKSKNGA